MKFKRLGMVEEFQLSRLEFYYEVQWLTTIIGMCFFKDLFLE